MRTKIITYPDLFVAQQLAYDPYELIYESIINDLESREYSACTFRLNNQIVLFRTAKITPTKIGQFVTLWKRIGNSPIIPYDKADSFDLVIISVSRDKNLGHFIFPKAILIEKGFVSENCKGGKRAMRVYPPWDTPDNQQARKSQAWQQLYFVEITPVVEINKLKKLIRT